MVVDRRWCRRHGERVTALLWPGGEYRCDALVSPNRQWRCDMLLEPLTEREDDDQDDDAEGP